MNDIDDLIIEVINAAQSLATAGEWGSGLAMAERELEAAKSALREGVELLQTDADNSETCAELAAEIELLRDALQDLYDDWNGPETEALAKARAALNGE